MYRFHPLRLRQRGLAALLLGDVERQHEAAQRAAVDRSIGDQGRAHVDHSTVVSGAAVFVSDRMAFKGALQVGFYRAVELLADDLPRRAANDGSDRLIEPFGIASVGKAVDGARR